MKIKHTREELKTALLNLAYFFPRDEQMGKPVPEVKFKQLTAIVEDLLLENLTHKNIVNHTRQSKKK